VITGTALEYSHTEFSSFVRRFNQEAMLTAVARRALSLPKRLGQTIRRQEIRRNAAMALAGMAKASIVYGNAYRRAIPSEQDVIMACHMHNNLVAEELRQPDLNSGSPSSPGSLTSSSPTMRGDCQSWPAGRVLRRLLRPQAS